MTIAIRLQIEERRATAFIKLDSIATQLLPQLEGRKQWLVSGALAFEPTQINLDRFGKLYQSVEIEDKRQGSTQGSAIEPLWPEHYEYRTKPYRHQIEAFERSKTKTAFALFMGQGTGKTKVAIDRAAFLWKAQQITGVLVAAGKGVHVQWVEAQLPDHMPLDVPVNAFAWNKRRLPDNIMNTDKLGLFSINIDALKTDSGFEAAERFIIAHHGRVLMIIDESQAIKSHSALRTKACCALGAKCNYRMIMTGTPIAKDLSDEWSQFKFLDDRIIGHRYLTSFRAEYCIMGGYEGREVLGNKNIEQFRQKTDSHSFRVTKEEELDLPPKIYERFVFEMAPDQAQHYRSLKDTFLTLLENGEFATVANAAVLVTRLQQITSGALVGEAGQGKQRIVQKLTNSRLAALEELLASIEGKVIIWARFHYDVEAIKVLLGDKAVTYYGPDSTAERQNNKERFISDPAITYFIASQSTGGVGVDGLQRVCRTAIYYTNSYNAIDRWQSEDRIHRIGTTGSVTYIDMVCKGSTDLKMLANLHKKKSLSDLVLGDLKDLVQ